MQENEMECQGAQELITGLVDDELSPQELSSIKSHLADCLKCQWIYSEEQALKRELRDAVMSIRAPAVLRDKILRDQRRFLRRARLSEMLEKVFRLSSFVPQAAAFAATLVLLALSTLYWSQSTQMPVAPGVFRSYTQIVLGEINPIKTRSITDLKENLVRSVEGRFAPMAYDFSAMDLRLVGGLFKEIANRQVLVTVYEGNGSILVCYTFLGSEDDAPAISEVLFDRDKGMNFYQFSQGQTNAVMHREGQVMCILVSQIRMDKLLALARAKAHAS